MRPRADEIMRSVIATFDEYVAPDVTDPFAKSLTLTLSNLMRNVALRIQREGQVLFDDNARLRDVLVAIRVHCESRPGEPWAAVTAEITDALDREYYAPGVYPSLELVTGEATALRWALQHAIAALDETATVPAEDADAVADLRRQIRSYLRASLELEMSLIVPAFTGERR